MTFAVSVGINGGLTFSYSLYAASKKKGSLHPQAAFFYVGVVRGPSTEAGARSVIIPLGLPAR